MKQAAKEVSSSNKTNVEQMRSIARAYESKRERSVQEVGYLVVFEQELTLSIKRFLCHLSKESHPFG